MPGDLGDHADATRAETRQSWKRGAQFNVLDTGGVMDDLNLFADGPPLGGEF